MERTERIAASAFAAGYATNGSAVCAPGTEGPGAHRPKADSAHGRTSVRCASAGVLVSGVRVFDTPLTPVAAAVVTAAATHRALGGVR